MSLSLPRAAIVFLFATAALRGAALEAALGGPEVQKLDWNTRSLQAVDVNGDGLVDLIVANNDRATIDILYQIGPGEARDAVRAARASRWEPVVEDARFRRERVTTGVTMYDLTAADLNGDGRVDLVYTGDPQSLTVQYRQEDGAWIERKLGDAPGPIQLPGGLRVADLNGDGRNDVVMLGLKELAIFYQDETGGFAAPQRFPLADENCYGLDIFDVDGDGRPDIVYLATTPRDALRLRLQSADSQFGPEQACPIKEARSTLQLLSPADTGAGQGARLVFAQQRTGQLEFVSLEPSKNDGAVPALRPRVFTPRAPGKTAASYAFGDFDGDGREDIAVGDADGAQVFVYFRQADGGFTVAKRFPSFADVRGMAAGDWTGDGRADLIVASLKEQSVGVSSVNAEGRLDYPRPLPGTGRPLALASGRLSDGRGLSVVVVREERGRRWFDVIERGADGVAVIARTVELNGLKTDPRGLRLLDANQDGRLDIAIFTPFDSMRLFVQGEDGGFADAGASAGFRKGLVDNLDSSAVSSGDVTGDGRDALLVSAGGFVRALRLDAEGSLVVVDQFNARDLAAEITASFVIPPAAGGRPEVLLYDRKGEQFQRLHANAHGVYEVVDTVAAGRLDVTGAEVRRPAGGGRFPELFLLGRDRFWWLPLDRGDFIARPAGSHTTDLPDIHYGDVIAGDLTGDGRVELVTLDPERSVIEILTRDEEAGTWVSRLHFKVFETDEHYQGRRGGGPEPREALVADVTGDGKKDLILLVHDRVLVYPQK